MVGEADDLDVVNFAERHIGWEFVGERIILGRIGEAVEGMNVAYERALRVRHIGHVGIGGIRAGGGSVGIGDIAGEQEIDESN